MGMSKNEFMHSTPKVLKAYGEAYRIKLKTIDRLAWQFGGSYILSAVSVAVEHCLAGKKAKSEFVKKPILQEYEDANRPLSEAEKQQQRELFVATLEAMKTNFELNHKQKKGGDNDGNIKRFAGQNV